MIEIKLEKRYPHSRTEDITDAFMRGYQQGKEDEHRWWSNHCANCKEAEQTEPNCSEKPNNCDTCKWGEWYRKGYDITMMSDECGGCCSWNNKWTPKDEPQTDCAWK